MRRGDGAAFRQPPDWVKFPTAALRLLGRTRRLALPLVARVVTLGCCSDDLTRPDRRGANLRALRSGELAMLPWRVAATPLGRRAGPVPGHDVDGDALHWRTLVGSSPEAILARLVPEITTESIWISLDKDVLATHEAATNWDQGAMPLATLEAVLSALAGRYDVRGIDICGDYSPARHRNAMKWTEALLDQPRRPPPSLAVNEATNERLLSLLERVL